MSFDRTKFPPVPLNATEIEAAWAESERIGAVADIARVNAELATVKVTPGHSWCATCGANKPHEHHHVCPACDRFIGCRQPVMHCECGAEIRSFDAPDGAR